MPLSQILTGSLANNITITTTGNVSANIVSVGTSAVSPVQSFRNKIINGNFDFWQRGTSFSATGYGADRWWVSVNGSTYAVSRQAFTLGQTAVPNEPTYYYRNVVTTSAGAGNYCVIQHRIESVRTLAGQTATLSFWAKADASKNIAIEFYQYFGSGGSPSADVSAIGVTTCALTTSWQKFTVTVNVPSISGKTLGSDNNDFLQCGFWFDAGSNFNARTNSLGQQSGTFDIAQVQLEAGSVATPFEVRPMQTELALCQRYYQLGRGDCRAALNTIGQVGYHYPFSVTMRTTATISLLSISSGTPAIAFQRSDGFVFYGTSIENTATFSASAEL